MELIGHILLGLSCGVSGRIGTCSFFKASHGVSMRLSKSHIVGQNNIPPLQGSHLIKHEVIFTIGLYLAVGLNLILDRHFDKILIQTDSIEAINVILEDSSGSSNSSLVRKIHIILRKMEQWKIQYILKEKNLIVDCLAKFVRNRRLGSRLFEDPPMRVAVQLLEFFELAVNGLDIFEELVEMVNAAASGGVLRTHLDCMVIMGSFWTSRARERA
ncbi:hypothetical protein J1N35_032922 [Gossypium stocksii]|uniref:RNase H type-1 domain-containing protein n=1 Tax=Gossypium stocksii TaxID=47602 RepID=A0A9D3V4D7_9ROSI|nr:hypothetical protein J1N35_032922 [Gossypium stocksii]